VIRATASSNFAASHAPVRRMPWNRCMLPDRTPGGADRTGASIPAAAGALHRAVDHDRHRFVELHMEDVEHTPPRYEARVFIGPDTLSGHVVGHWLDNFGAAYSVPPAIGVAAGDSLTLDFPYPDAAFHDTFVYDATAGSWTIRLDAADGKGGWKRFADYRAVRR
jgi:hypothetical protein